MALKYIEKTDQGELIYGVHPIIECLKARKRRLLSLYVAQPEPKGWKRIKPMLPSHMRTIQFVSRDVLTRMAGTSDHMGIVGWVEPFVYETKPFDKTLHKRVLVLDGVQDVRNMGAILRSAYCTGFTAVLIPKKGNSPVTAAALKASAGLAEHLAIYMVPKVPHTLTELAAMGYSIYPAVVEGGRDARDIRFEAPLCIVIGSEEGGVDQAVRKMGTSVTLPQRDTSSYNASVAAGILLFLSSFGVSR